MTWRFRPATYLWLAVGILIGLYLAAGAFSTFVRLAQPTEFVYGEAVVLARCADSTRVGLFIHRQLNSR